MQLEMFHYLLLATVSEALSEYFFSGIKIFERGIKYLSALVGVIVAIIFQADIFTFLGLESQYPILSQILTGLVISRGSNVLNDLIQTVYNFKKKLTV